MRKCIKMGPMVISLLNWIVRISGRCIKIFWQHLHQSVIGIWIMQDVGIKIRCMSWQWRQEMQGNIWLQSSWIQTMVCQIPLSKNWKQWIIIISWWIPQDMMREQKSISRMELWQEYGKFVASLLQQGIGNTIKESIKCRVKIRII